jgi:hypothetical protein
LRFFEEQKSTLLGVYTNFIASRYKVYTNHTRERVSSFCKPRTYEFKAFSPEDSLLSYKNQVVKMHPEDLAKLRDCDFSFLPDTIELENIFEVKAFEGKVYKIAFRLPLPNTPDTHISCVIEGKTLITFWLNEATDTHSTLDARQYAS